VTVGRPILPTLVGLRNSTRNVRISWTHVFPFLLPLSGYICIVFFSSFPSHIFFFSSPFPPRPLTFFCASSNCRYVISFTWSFFRSFCLRISVFHNSLSLTLPTSPSVVVPRVEPRAPFILWHRTLFLLSLLSLYSFCTPIYPHLTCEMFGLHVIVTDLQNNDQRKRLESICARQAKVEPRRPRRPWSLKRLFHARGKIQASDVHTIHVKFCRLQTTSAMG